MLTRTNIGESDLWDLGKFDPSPSRHKFLAEDFYQHVSNYVNLSSFYNSFNSPIDDEEFFEGISYRNPVANKKIHDERNYGIYDIAREWHYDVSHSPLPNHGYILMWTSIAPTELKRPRGTVEYFLPPKHVVIIDNHRWKHRMPQMTHHELSQRHFLRVFLYARKTKG